RPLSGAMALVAAAPAGAGGRASVAGSGPIPLSPRCGPTVSTTYPYDQVTETADIPRSQCILGYVIPECPANDLVQRDLGPPGAPAPGFSDSGVRYADGAVRLPEADVSSGGFGTGWGQTRNWTNVPDYDRGSFNG